MTLNGVIAVILRYFSEFGYLSGVLRKSSRSLSHLLMSSCIYVMVTITRLSLVTVRCTTGGAPMATRNSHTPFTRYNRLSHRLYNRTDNRLNEQPLFVQPVVKPELDMGNFFSDPTRPDPRQMSKLVTRPNLTRINW